MVYDGLPFLIAWWFSMANCECHNQFFPWQTVNVTTRWHIIYYFAWKFWTGTAGPGSNWIRQWRHASAEKRFQVPWVPWFLRAASDFFSEKSLGFWRRFLHRTDSPFLLKLNRSHFKHHLWLNHHHGWNGCFSTSQFPIVFFITNCQFVNSQFRIPKSTWSFLMVASACLMVFDA